MDIEKLRKKIVPVLKRYGVRRSGIFGSLVRGEGDKDSDLDILVDIKDDLSLLDLVGLKIDLEEVVGRRVDLVEYDAIKPMIRKNILGEQVVIL